jgi:hypothetical protein
LRARRPWSSGPFFYPHPPTLSSFHLTSTASPHRAPEAGCLSVKSLKAILRGYA